MHGEHHDSKKLPEDDKIKKVSELYLQSVHPIFKKSCFDCHGMATEMPWYHKLPVVKGLMDKDMTDAKKHLDMSKGFPFDGHGSIQDDLVAISKNISSNKMPPTSYRLMHPSAKLNSEELEAINRWIATSKTILQ